MELRETVKTDKQIQYRQVKLTTEVRTSEQSGKELIIRGYPIVFNERTKIYDFWEGWFDEIIERSALDGVDLSNVYLLHGHDPNLPLGRAGKNLRLEVDDTGVFMECVLPNTQLARDDYNLIQPEIIDGMSFGAYIKDDIDRSKGLRTIKSPINLIEVSITPFPAYEAASVVARQRNDERLKREAEQKELKELRAAQGEKTEPAINTDTEAAEKARAELEDKLKKLEAM